MKQYFKRHREKIMWFKKAFTKSPSKKKTTEYFCQIHDNVTCPDLTGERGSRGIRG
jgi:hypothetical protein